MKARKIICTCEISTDVQIKEFSKENISGMFEEYFTQSGETLDIIKVSCKAVKKDAK